MDKNPASKLSLTLHIDTGNIIYEEFDNAEEAMAFMQHYFNNPEAILKKITPRKNIQEDISDSENNPPIEPSGDSPI